MVEYSKLQNGSDIRGVALPLVAAEPVNLTEEAAGQIGRAFAAWLVERCGKPAEELRIAVGRDSRLSGPSLQRAVLTGLVAMGAVAADCGMASTPAMFMATVLPGCDFDGAVMITASHLPQNRNGLKFFTREGGLESADIKELLRRAVLAGGCDLGLIFDTDVDRAGAVEADGTELGRNRLIALAAAIAAEQAPGSTIVTDSVTSDQLADFIEKKLGCRHHRFKRGYKNVINEAIRLNEAGETCLLAMETSGHGALKENYFLDDGAYLATKIVIRYAQLRRQGRTLADLLEGMREPLEARELRFRLLPEDFKAAGAAVLAALERYAASQPGWVPAPHNYEGLRYSVPAVKGWFLLRMSLHDPLMPLNIESDCPGGAEEILRELAPFLKGQAALDTAQLG